MIQRDLHYRVVSLHCKSIVSKISSTLSSVQLSRGNGKVVELAYTQRTSRQRLIKLGSRFARKQVVAMNP